MQNKQPNRSDSPSPTQLTWDVETWISKFPLAYILRLTPGLVGTMWIVYGAVDLIVYQKMFKHTSYEIFLAGCALWGLALLGRILDETRNILGETRGLRGEMSDLHSSLKSQAYHNSESINEFRRWVRYDEIPDRDLSISVTCSICKNDNVVKCKKTDYHKWRIDNQPIEEALHSVSSSDQILLSEKVCVDCWAAFDDVGLGGFG